MNSIRPPLHVPNKEALADHEYSTRGERQRVLPNRHGPSLAHLSVCNRYQRVRFARALSTT